MFLVLSSSLKQRTTNQELRTKNQEPKIHMYLHELYFENSRLNHQALFKPAVTLDKLNRFTILRDGDYTDNSELLRILALAGSGCTAYLHGMDFDLRSLARESKNLSIQIVWQEHCAGNKTIVEKLPGINGIQIDQSGKGKKLTAVNIHNPQKYPILQLGKWSPPAKHMLLAYGNRFTEERVDDDLSFSDPFYQLKKISSLFNAEAGLTCPAAFLSNLSYRSIRFVRYMPTRILSDLLGNMSSCLNINISNLMEKDADYTKFWKSLSPELRTTLLPIIDAARHLHDALPSHPNPLHFPGIMILDRPDLYCPEDYFQQWTMMLGRIFPAMQFIISLPSGTKFSLTPDQQSQTLPGFKKYRYNNGRPYRSRNSAEKLPSRTILLIDVDSRLPNLALMKIAGYYRNQGYRVKLAQKTEYFRGAEMVFASIVFNTASSHKHLKILRTCYGDSIEFGGSGVDLQKRLPGEIEQAQPDYELYPELGDRAIGFLTRGCPFNCSFCIVPIKEGKPRQVTDVDTLARGREKLILLDDNILACPGCEELLKEISRRKMQVNFNQTLDLNLINEEKARILRSIQSCNVRFTRTVYHFSLNDNLKLDRLREKYELLNFSPRDNVEFVCMYGFNTTLAQDLERFRFLRSLPGAYVFVQEYQPILSGPKPRLDDYFDDHADEYIDELCRICFSQCMKSMEKYYRWLSRFYAEKFGRLHMPLVDTIFRYNKKFNRGRYIASLAGTRDILN